MLEGSFGLKQQLLVDGNVLSVDCQVEDAIREERELMRGKEVANRTIFRQFFSDWNELQGLFVFLFHCEAE